jgi:glutamate/tyrosine decarboxylase-like PLP-dependent enzyme
MLAAPAAYLTQHEEMREPDHYTPELSRRGRGIEIWAAFVSLGRSGLSDLVERCCDHAKRFAEGLKAQGWDVLNEVVLNQVMVALESDAATQEAIARLQSDGTCWCGPTNWRGRVAMRISVSSWATTPEDVERSLEAMSRARQKS